MLRHNIFSNGRGMTSAFSTLPRAPSACALESVSASSLHEIMLNRLNHQYDFSKATKVPVTTEKMIAKLFADLPKLDKNSVAQDLQQGITSLQKTIKQAQYKIGVFSIYSDAAIISLMEQMRPYLTEMQEQQNKNEVRQPNLVSKKT